MGRILIFTSLLLSILSQSAFADTKTLKIPLYASEISLDPSGVQDQSSLWVSRQINCQLVRLSEGKIVNEAAEQIEFTTPLKLKISLKNNVFFTDGEKVTSDDVINSFLYLKDSRKVLRNIFDHIKTINKIDNRTIEIELTRPSPILRTLSSPHYSIHKSSFIEQISRGTEDWSFPIGCGGYQIVPSGKKELLMLKSITGKLNIYFFLSQKNQVESKEAHKFDIISSPVVGSDIHEKDFILKKVFDPYHLFFGLNTKKDTWKAKSKRCSLFSKINVQSILKAYGDQVELAKDFFPRGVLGYKPRSPLIKTQEHDYIEKKNNVYDQSFCLSTLSVSIPEKYRESFLEVFKSIYKKVDGKSILDTKNFVKIFQNSNCDIIAMGLKSNYLDGYEYLLTYSEREVNLTGYWDEMLVKKIKESQSIENAEDRAQIYQSLSEEILGTCTIYPIATIPYKSIYVKKGLMTPDIGKVPLNEYYLGNVFYEKAKQ